MPRSAQRSAPACVSVRSCELLEHFAATGSRRRCGPIEIERRRWRRHDIVGDCSTFAVQPRGRTRHLAEDSSAAVRFAGAAARLTGAAVELVRAAVGFLTALALALAVTFVLTATPFRAVEVFFLATRGRAAGFARRTAAFFVTRAVFVALRAVFLAALRAILREAAVFFAPARARLPLLLLAARFRTEPRTAFRLAIASSLQP